MNTVSFFHIIDVTWPILLSTAEWNEAKFHYKLVVLKGWTIRMQQEHKI